MLVRSETYQEFEQNFSISSIRQRVAQEIPDYGGDYKRKFEDTYKWVNIRTIYEKNLAPHEVILCFRDVDIEKKQQLQYTALLEDALSTAKQSTKAQTTFSAICPMICVRPSTPSSVFPLWPSRGRRIAPDIRTIYGKSNFPRNSC